MNRYLLDLNVLVALGDERHVHHEAALRWLSGISGSEWGACAFTQAGFLRVMTNPGSSGYSVQDATEVLASMTQISGYRFWPVQEDWTALSRPFLERVFGHQQITDAWLLGLAVKEQGILVTFDKGLRHLAGVRYRDYVLLLE